MVIAYIAGYIDAFGVELICRTLNEVGIKIAPSTYYDPYSPCPQQQGDTGQDSHGLPAETVHADFYVYGARKLYALINQDHHLATHGQGSVARCTVERLMKRARI